MGSNRMPNRQEVKKIRKMFLVSYVSKTSISDTVLLVLWDSQGTSEKLNTANTPRRLLANKSEANTPDVVIVMLQL